MAPISESRKRANDNYLQKLDEIKVRVPKGKKNAVQTHAAARGESVNGFINRAISETMERDENDPGAPEGPGEAKKTPEIELRCLANSYAPTGWVKIQQNKAKFVHFSGFTAYGF